MTCVADVRAALAEVVDPELPVLTIADLGVLRDVRVDGEAVTVTLTPTYSGCPALEQMRADVVAVLAAHGWSDVTVLTVLAPAWTTEWMSEAGRRKLLEHGVAPPSGAGAGPVRVTLGRRAAACPRCCSSDTEELSRFGATSCRALWRCRSCREPFDVFKEH